MCFPNQECMAEGPPKDCFSLENELEGWLDGLT